MVNELLDASLARYSTSEPRRGLDGRVLARVRAAQSNRKWFVWVRGLAAGVVAAGIVFGLFTGLFNLVDRSNRYGNSPVPARQAGPPLIAKRAPAPQMITPQLSFRRAASHGRTSATVKYGTSRTELETHLETQPAEFPTPRPVTQEEKLLAQYVRVTPAPVLSASLTDSTTIPDLEIKPLNISPLENEGAEPEDN